MYKEEKAKIVMNMLFISIIGRKVVHTPITMSLPARCSTLEGMDKYYKLWSGADCPSNAVSQCSEDGIQYDTTTPVPGNARDTVT